MPTAHNRLQCPFQPTPSARRVTEWEPSEVAGMLISTHTLRKEGDAPVYIVYHIPRRFQPTPSARRVTNRREVFYVVYINFNPHPPQGG